MKSAFIMGPVQAHADTNGRPPGDLWQFLYYGAERETGRQAQKMIGAHGDYESAAAAAHARAQAHFIAPRLINSTLATA